MHRMKPIELGFDENEPGHRTWGQLRQRERKGDVLGTSHQDFPIAVLSPPEFVSLDLHNTTDSLLQDLCKRNYDHDQSLE